MTASLDSSAAHVALPTGNVLDARCFARHALELSTGAELPALVTAGERYDRMNGR